MRRWIHRLGFLFSAAVLAGCAAPAVVPGSAAEAQLHAPCPASGACAAPLSCIAPSAGEPGTCELACTQECPPPMLCMPRTDGTRGGVCTERPADTVPWRS